MGMNWFWSRPIGHKVLVIFLALTLASTAIYVISSTWLLNAVVLQQTERELERAALNLTDIVRISVDASIKSYLRGIAEKDLDMVRFQYLQARQGRISMAEARQRAAAMLLHQPVGKTGYVYVVDGRGIVRVHPRTALQGQDLTQYDFIRRQIQRPFGYLEYEWANPGEATAKPKALYMAYFEPWDWIISVSSYREEFSGLVNASDFREPFLNVRFGDTGYPFILDMSGTLVVHPTLEHAMIADSRDSAGRYFIREMLARKDGQIVYPWQNPGELRPRKKLVVFRYLPEMGWIVATSSYLEEYYMGRTLFLRTMVASLAISTLLVVLALVWIRKAVTRPLTGLTERVIAAGGGGGTTESRDEVHLFRTAFEGMMTRIEESRLQLQESENRYRGIFENAVEGIFRTTEDGRFESANPSLARILGYPSAEALVLRVRDIGLQVYHDPDGRRAFLQQLDLHGLVQGFEVELKRPDGSVIWVSISARREAVPEGMAILGFMVDITQEHAYRRELNGYRDHLEEMVTLRTRELLEAKEQAEAAARAKGIFLASMSHELRTPLNAVIGYSQIMAKSLRDPAHVANMERILRAGEHLLDLINDVLSITQIESGRVALLSDPFETRSFFRAIEEMIRVRAEAKGLDFSVELPPRLPEALLGDSKKLRQVLVNLLDNALKFTDSGRIRLSVTHDGDGYRFAVEDTGIGIDPGDFERIFRLFEQAGDEKRATEGTGLGLHISQVLVQLMGGRLSVESVPGEGSRFSFTIALPTAEFLVREWRHEQIPHLAEGEPVPKVLIIDDVEDNRDMLEKVLTTAGLTVVSAVSGQQGLERWEAWEPDIVCLDLCMPGLSGWEVARALRERESTRPGRRVFLLAVSASTLTLDPETLRAAGFDDWIAKPVRLPTLFALLDRRLGLRFQESGQDAPTAPATGLPDAGALDPAWREAFLKNLELGDSEALLASLEGREGGPGWQRLRQLVREYRYEELGRFLRAGGDDGHA